MKIHTLGYGGAFDVNEGNSSFIVEMNGKNYLIDCGWDVFPKLIKSGWAAKIDYICVTHCHDDHIGSLSAYLYYLHFVLKKEVPIITDLGVEGDLMNVLRTMNMKYGVHYTLIEEDIPEVKTLNTRNCHDKGMMSCGFVFDNKFLFSGDINRNIFTLYYNDDFVLKKNLIIFHEATNFKCEVHTYYKDLENLKGKNLYLYHHSDQAAEELEKEGYKTVRQFKELEF